MIALVRQVSPRKREIRRPDERGSRLVVNPDVYRAVVTARSCEVERRFLHYFQLGKHAFSQSTLNDRVQMRLRDRRREATRKPRG